MALTQTQGQIAENVRQFANAKGTTALLRHPNTNVYDYINRAHGSLHRKLTEAGLGDRFLSTTTVTTASGTSTYSLPATFDHLISIDMSANGAKFWLSGHEMNERPGLTDPSATYTGVPLTYRLRGSNIEYLPTPSGVYTSVLWYVPTPTNWATDGSDSSSLFDTINRLDDYIIAYAARFIATKDRAWDLVNECKELCKEIAEEIEVIGHARDRNSPPRPINERPTNRFGRRMHVSRFR
jgi:hypothetical protein